MTYESAPSATEPAAPSRPGEAGRGQLRPRGSNHVGMRQYNERVLLQAIRLHGELPKAELARLTHLSNQTVSMIVNALLEDGLVVKREPLRGRIGQLGQEGQRFQQREVVLQRVGVADVEREEAGPADFVDEPGEAGAGVSDQEEQRHGTVSLLRRWAIGDGRWAGHAGFRLQASGSGLPASGGVGFRALGARR